MSEEFRPLFAQHVVGYIPREVFGEDGQIEPATVRMVCEACGDKHQIKCATGAYRQWVTKFATIHLHRDPLAPISVAPKLKKARKSSSK